MEESASRIKKILAILLSILFVVSLTAVSASGGKISTVGGGHSHSMAAGTGNKGTGDHGHYAMGPTPYPTRSIGWSPEYR